MTGVSGVRGVWSDSLSPETVLRYAASFGVFLHTDSLNPANISRPKVIVGRDSRTTGVIVLNTVVSALLSVGCDVIDIGIVATPTVLLNVQKHSAQGGIAITASHNPPQWNAMKFVDGDGMFLSAEKAGRFLASVQNEIIWKDWQNIGTLSSDYDAIDFHINKVLKLRWLDIDKIRAKRFKVVLDSVNGAGGLISPLLLEGLNCEVI